MQSEYDLNLLEASSSENNTEIERKIDEELKIEREIKELGFVRQKTLETQMSPRMTKKH